MPQTTLSPRQQTFVAEYCRDQNGAAAARRAGYSGKSNSALATAANRLLTNRHIKAAIDSELKKRAERYEITAEMVLRQLGRIAFANPRDFVDDAGEALDLRKLTDDQAMAISQFEIEDVVDKRTGEVRRRTKIKLADRHGALASLTKVLGMVVDRHLVEGSVEYRIKSMTPEERVARVQELREKAEREYLPRYLEMQANVSPVIDETAVQGDAADDQPAVSTPAAQPEPSAGLGSELPVNGGGHVDQPRRAARQEIRGQVDANQTSGWQMWPGHNTP